MEVNRGDGALCVIVYTPGNLGGTLVTPSRDRSQRGRPRGQTQLSSVSSWFSVSAVRPAIEASMADAAMVRSRRAA